MPADRRGPLPRIDRMSGPPAVVQRADGPVLLERVYFAEGRRARAIGLLGTRRLAPDEALWIPRCRRVQTWGMAGPIAVVLLDADGVVLRIADPVPPWRIVGDRRARAVLEAPAGLGARLRPGERLRLAR